MGGCWFHFFCIMYSLYQSIKVSFSFLTYQSIKFSFSFLTYQSIKVSFSFLSSEDYYVFLSAGCFRVLGIFSIKVQDLSFLLSSKLSILGIVFIDSCLVQRNTFVSMDFSLLLCCREERYLIQTNGERLLTVRAGLWGSKRFSRQLFLGLVFFLSCKYFRDLNPLHVLSLLLVDIYDWTPFIVYLTIH